MPKIRVDAEREISICHRPFPLLTREERTQLYSLALRKESGMRGLLERTFNYQELQALIARKNEHVVGWAALNSLPLDEVGTEESGSVCIYVYVARRYRRQGVGRKLLESAVRMVEERKFGFLVFPWNKASEAFFQSCVPSNNIYRNNEDFYD